MNRRRAVTGSAVFFVVAPGLIAGLLPWWLTGWRPAAELPGWWFVVAGLGWVVLAAGLAVLVACFVRFVTEGGGTPAPVAPPSAVVAGGLYAWVRNPMYLGILAILLGQVAILGRGELLGYTAAVAAAFVAFVTLYEEPTLAATFGEEYAAYRRRVPGWWPRRPRP